MFKGLGTNTVSISGKVTNIYEEDDITYISIGVFYEHFYKGEKVYADSVFRALVNDMSMIVKCRKIKKGDLITIKGHLHQEYSMTSGGNKKHFVRLYADEIQTN